MDSLNHLKTKYRPRYFNREGQRQAIDVQEENVLNYIQGCFETCAKDFTVYSPTISCSSSSSLEQDQGDVPFHSEEEEQPEPQMLVQTAFNTITCLPSPNGEDRCPGEKVSEDDERSSITDVQDDDDFDIVSLGSPIFLEEEISEGTLHSGEHMFVVNVEKGRDVTHSEMCPARKETNQLSTEETKSAASPSQNKMSESAGSLDAMKTSFTQRNAANVEPEDDCEFLIEESFGMASTSWISASQKNQKRQKKSLISVSSRQKKEVNQHSVRKKDKRTSEKPVTPTPVKQTTMKLTNVAETTVDRLQNVSSTNETMSLVDDQPLLVLNTIQEGRQNMHFKSKESKEVSNKISRSINLTEDHAALLEENESSAEQSRPVPKAADCPPSSRRTMKKRQSETKASVERQNEWDQERASAAMASESSYSNKNTDMHAENSVSLLNPISSEQKSSNKKSQTAELKSSSKKSQCAELKSSSEKTLKRQKPPRTALSKKQSETKRNAVKESVIRTTRRKKRVLVSDDSSENEHGDEQCNKGTENLSSYELRGITHSKKESQKIRQTSLGSSEDDYEGVSYQEDSFEHYLAEKRLHSSMKQQNNATGSLQSFSAPDVNMNNFSGPLDNNKTSSKQEETFDREESSSNESGDFTEDLDGFVSNSLKRKLVLPSNTPNVRRTKRMRIRPLEYWRGERVEYKTRPSGGFVVRGIISPEQKEPRKSKPKKTVKPVMELDDMPDNSVISLKDPSQPAVVFNAATNQEVLLKCVNSGSSHLFFIANEAVSIYKYLTTPSFSAGKMILKPLKEKGCQYSHTDTLVFHISHGKLLLTLYDQCYHLTVGDYFYIPPGNVYNIRNLLNKDCVILFTQLKGKRSES